MDDNRRRALRFLLLLIVGMVLPIWVTFYWLSCQGRP